MKKLLTKVLTMAALSSSAYGQLVFFRDCNASNPTSNDVTINGVVDSSQDLNAQLLVGTTAGNVTTDVVTLLLSGGSTATSTTALGTVQPAAGDISAVGLIVDQTGNGYKVPAGTDYYEILLWTGNYSSYAAAEASGQPDVYAGETPVLTTWSGIPAPGAPPGLLDLDSNPIELYPAPEPSSLAMATVGIGSILVFGCRKFVRLG